MNQPLVKSRSQRIRSRRPVRRHFGPEPLEPRHLPSITLPGIAATSPADGATVLQGPQSFAITFNQSDVENIDAIFSDLFGITADQVLPTIVALDTGADVEVDQIGADSTVTPFLGGASAWTLQDTVNTTVAPDGTIQTRLDVSLPTGSPPMTPGTYQLDIQPLSNLGAAFAWLHTNSPWATATAPIPIARFTVLGQGPTLGGATNLGPIGPKTQSFSGFLNPGDIQSAVALYQFSVPQGQGVQFDAKILAHAINSPLLSTLTLFDSNGDVLATRSASGGSGADSTDPELVLGLGPGRYFLGISAADSVPGQGGGYDPVSGKPGTAGVNDPAGPFVLEVSATPVGGATRLVDFNLDYADSLEPAPTGLDLTFSAPVDVTGLSVPDRQETALTVVDSSGRAWPISVVNYRSDQNQLSFIFNEALPPGHYTLIAPKQGGLTDLSGRPVAGPVGNPADVLASWTIAAPNGPSDPNNLGVLWPGLVNVTWNAAVSGTTTLAAGQASDERFVVICPGFYGLQTQPGVGSVDIRIENSQGATVAEADNQTQLNTMLMSLTPGVYHMQITDAGTYAASVQWTLKPVSLDYEKILGNGVGQSPSLGLSLVGPPTGGPEAPANPEGPGGATAIATTGGAIFTGSGTAATPFAASPIPTVLLVTMETGLAGLPSPDSGHTAAVGPLADGATVVLADASRGLPAGFRYASSSSGTDPRVGESDPADGPDAFPPPSTARSGSSRPAGVADPQTASAAADASALAQADRLGRIAELLAGRIVVTPSDLSEADLPATELGTTLFAAAGPTNGAAAPGAATADGPLGDSRRDRLAQADLGAPFTLLVTTFLTYRLSEPIRKWWRRQHSGHAAWPRPHGFGRRATAAGGGI